MSPFSFFSKTIFNTALLKEAFSTKNTISKTSSIGIRLQYWRLLLPVFIVIIASQSTFFDVIVSVLADAFFQVSVFVAATLTVYYFAAYYFTTSQFAKTANGHPFYSVVIATTLGVLPGCGGAIIVITQFTKGKVSFGSVVAVLTATMGDAAFLLLAQQPLEGLLVIAISAATGLITGYIVNILHGQQFMQIKQRPKATEAASINKEKDILLVGSISTIFWQILLIPALVIGVLGAFQIDVNALFGLAEGRLEVIGATLCFAALVLWALSSKGQNYQQVTSEERRISGASVFRKVAMDTQFITSWVVVAFLAFELSMLILGIDQNATIAVSGEAAVFGAVLIGLLPGCGPQIMTTGLYLQGLLPFSAQLANAISNDGDALFPALALAPRAAILATLYSAIPAFLVGFGYMFLFE
ncbi:MAG: putative manganese transporter [Pseudomonadota bacterium]